MKDCWQTCIFLAFSADELFRYVNVQLGYRFNKV